MQITSKASKLLSEELERTAFNHSFSSVHTPGDVGVWPIFTLEESIWRDIAQLEHSERETKDPRTESFNKLINSLAIIDKPGPFLSQLKSAAGRCPP